MSKKILDNTTLAAEQSAEASAKLHERQPKARKQQHELLPFLAICAVQYQKDHGLDGLHPIHYDLMEKYGAQMDRFKRATMPETTATASSSSAT